MTATETRNDLGMLIQRTSIKQTAKLSKQITYHGKPHQMVVTARFDDECKNGHCTFAITADIQPIIRMLDGGYSSFGRSVAGGCLHEDIAKHFPQLAKYIKWHLVSTDAPMHYLANTLYHAGDLDHNGRAKGEPSSFELGIRFGNSPITHKLKKSFYEFLKARIGTGEFQVFSIEHAPDSHKFAPHWSLVGYGEKWHECPFTSEAEAVEFALALNTLPVEFVTIATAFSEGKARDFAAARNAACWPEATDEQLSLPKAELKALLEARLSGILADFRRDIEALGFDYDFPAQSR